MLGIKILNIALIFAGGVGRRMGNQKLPKQFLKVGGRSIISLTIQNFQQHKKIDGIFIVSVDSHISECINELSVDNLSKVIDVIPGGRTAQESILFGLRRIKEFSSKNNTILIHDGVRPIISEDLISQNIDIVGEYGASVTIAPCNETILLRKDDMTFGALDRDKCIIARAPQCYKIDDVLPAAEYYNARKKSFVDTYSLMEDYGISAFPVLGDYSNIKVTTSLDFLMVKALIEGR